MNKFDIVRMSTDRVLKTFESYESARNHWLELEFKEQFVLVRAIGGVK